jgi:predicted dehydrogenase
MNRREFNRLSALALAAWGLPAGAQSASTGVRPVGFAAVGLGTISEVFMNACSMSRGAASITGLVTGHPDTKGVKYSGMYGVAKSSIYTYETFDRIRDDKNIEAVYIGLPNSMHAEYTVRAAQAGKHVLCEKPMAISSAECKTMIDACQLAGVKLMIGYRVQYEPTWSHAVQRVKNGDLGTIKSFRGGFYGVRETGEWRLNRKLSGGGPIMDLGIYPLNAIRWITGEEPTDFTAVTSTMDKSAGRFIGIEESMEWTMKFPSGIIASCGCSYGEQGPAFLEIHGDRGVLEVNPGYFYDGVHFRGQGRSGPFEESATGRHPYEFVLEAKHFADCIRNNHEPKSPGAEGLKDLLAIEAIYRAAGKPIA